MLKREATGDSVLYSAADPIGAGSNSAPAPLGPRMAKCLARDAQAKRSLQFQGVGEVVGVTVAT